MKSQSNLELEKLEHSVACFSGSCHVLVARVHLPDIQPAHNFDLAFTYAQHRHI